MAEAIAIGVFTLLAGLGGAALTGWMNQRAERRRREDEQAARREERRAAEWAEVRREGASALAQAQTWLVDAHPDRLALNIDPERWQDTVRDLQSRLKELDEPLGVLSVRLPSRPGRDVASEFAAALGRVLHRGSWLLPMVADHKDFGDWRNDSLAEWEKAYELAGTLREAMHQADEP